MFLLHRITYGQFLISSIVSHEQFRPTFSLLFPFLSSQVNHTT